jgi:hypothetical protein
MTDQTFAAAALEWHDFFLAASGASAGHLGLLFVGGSINLAAMARDERLDLRARASQAFANLIFVLVIALLMLVPDPHPTAIAINLGLIATIGLVRVAKNLRPIIERRTRLPDWLGPGAPHELDGDCGSRPDLHGMEDLAVDGCRLAPEPGHCGVRSVAWSGRRLLGDPRRGQPRAARLAVMRRIDKGSERAAMVRRDGAAGCPPRRTR